MKEKAIRIKKDKANVNDTEVVNTVENKGTKKETVTVISTRNNFLPDGTFVSKNEEIEVSEDIAELISKDVNCGYIIK